VGRSFGFEILFVTVQMKRDPWIRGSRQLVQRQNIWINDEERRAQGPRLILIFFVCFFVIVAS
jgi:hypothetical protein